MKTLVTISHGPNRGEVGWINGTLEGRNASLNRVLVYFPKRLAPRDYQRVPLRRLREVTVAEALLCGVCVPENQSANGGKQ